MKKLFLSLCMMPALAFAQALLPTSWNFSDPGVANPPTGWSYSLGTGNLTYQSGVGDQVSLRLDNTDEYLQINFADKPGPLSYYIKGTAISPNPPFTGSFTVQESVDGSAWTTVRSFTSMTNSLTRYEDNLLAASRFVRFYYTTKQSGSNVQLDSVMIQNPPLPGNGISVKQGGDALVNGGNYVFGNAALKTFAIENFGVSADLHTDSIVLTGPDAADFTIGAFDSVTPPNNESDTFTVYFNPTANGSRFATLNVYSNDAERNPFVINLYAIGGTLATEPATQADAVNVSGVRTFTMNVSFSRATGGAEKYILLRKKGGAVTEIPADGITYQRGDYIGGAQVAYIGTDTALIKPTYILANTVYSYAAFAFNGPEGYENYNTASFPVKTVTTLANEIGTYYSSVNPSAANFISTLATRIRTPHDTIFYSNYAPTIVNNYLTRDTIGGKKIVNCVYTGIAYVYEEPFLWQSSTNTTGILTREHTFAQSWMPTKTSLPGFPEVNGREILEYNDLHHLFPADQNNANGVRSNNPFGVVVNVVSVSPTGFGKKGTDSNGKTVYEPKDDQKGNLARALFYMLVRYDGERGNTWRLPLGQDVSVLLQWHQQDPPDALEIARNEYIASIQHNRNPFIDHPEWVNRIDFNNMTYVPDPNATTITVTAPVSNAVIVKGKYGTITWTSQNVDSVLVEFEPSLSGPFTPIGKYAATDGAVTVRFTQAATNSGVIRISDVSNPLVNALSGLFKIVTPTIQVTAPANEAELTGDSSYTITWNKQYVDTVSVYYTYMNNGTPETVALSNELWSQSSFTFTAPALDIPEATIYVREKTALKTEAEFVYDSVNVSFKKFTGLTENNALNNLVTVYPVPTTGLVNITLPAYLTVTAVEVMDDTGRLVNVPSNDLSVTLPAKGLYIIRINTDKGTATKRVIVQ